MISFEDWQAKCKPILLVYSINTQQRFFEENTMKRIFALGILLTLSIALTACMGSSTNTNLGYNSYGANNANAAAAANTAVRQRNRR